MGIISAAVIPYVLYRDRIKKIRGNYDLGCMENESTCIVGDDVVSTEGDVCS